LDPEGSSPAQSAVLSASGSDLADAKDAGPIPSNQGSASQPRYYIKPDDTLLGIALRFKVDNYELCRLNNLPRSTVHTTPHLLHTRTYLTLPHSIPKSLIDNESLLVGPSSCRAVERAEKRLQIVTKEVDWLVAKAYVAVVEDGAGDNGFKKEDSDVNMKTDINEGRGALEMRAIDRYLDDAEWEESERKQGRGVFIQPFPFGSFGEKGSSSTFFRAKGFRWPRANR